MIFVLVIQIIFLNSLLKYQQFIRDKDRYNSFNAKQL